MAILFVPNDPLAQAGAPARQQPPRREPPAGRAGFAYTHPPAEAEYPIGSAEFLFWQCRESALAALETFELLSQAAPGLAQPLASWQGGKPTLALAPNAGRLLNAAYERHSLSFYEWPTPGKSTFSGASTDAVAHEVGHAILDALRPDLWDGSYTETAAFHEAFGDCFALLVGLFDADVRRALLQGPGLRQPNFLEAVAEDVSDGAFRTYGAQHPQAAPRRALNDLSWKLPIRLPKTGSPKVLSSEAHSFSRIFSGCFYDTLCNVFDGLRGGDEQALLEAAKIAGRLLVAAVREPPEVLRFFQAVGRMMILADGTESGGRHHAAIRNAFQAHGIALGSAVTAAPTAALGGAVAEPGDAGATHLGPAAKRDLRRRMRAPEDAKLALRPVEIAGRQVLAAVHRRIVKLGGLDPRLRGVFASATESVLVGSGERGPELLGALTDPASTVDEVRSFVETLLENGRIQFPGEQLEAFLPTHAIRRRGGRRMLTRVRFACCGSGFEPGREARWPD